ncbi:MAG: redox-sensing transcriptional repressor Rex [Ruminococcus sp.]|nr:redox-sensing transcriptional repressor Rex [Ruminococcus sp.]
MGREIISRSVIKRLPRYYSYLEELSQEGKVRISSKELADKMKLTASQIRQDLNNFGGFGHQGYGYNISDLRQEIGAILGVDERLKAILVGVGNIGTALATQINFQKRGFDLIGLFDVDEEIVGKEVNGIKVMHMDDLSGFCEKTAPVTAVLCIPKTAAYDVAKKLIDNGVTSFWNFSHFDLNVNFDGIVVENVHLGDSLLTLSYMTKNRQ